MQIIKMMKKMKKDMRASKTMLKLRKNRLKFKPKLKCKVKLLSKPKPKRKKMVFQHRTVDLKKKLKRLILSKKK